MACGNVWDTALSIIKAAGWNVVHEDKESGQVEMHVVMDLITWSEIFYLNFTKTDETMTRALWVGLVWLSRLIGALPGNTLSSFYSG